MVIVRALWKVQDYTNIRFSDEDWSKLSTEE